MYFSSNWWEEISGKKENAKVTGVGLLNTPKDTRGNEISKAPYDVEGEWNHALYHRKGEEIIFDFDPRKLKFWVRNLGFSKIRATKNRVYRGVVDLDTI